jgi:hypothetical protein
MLAGASSAAVARSPSSPRCLPRPDPCAPPPQHGHEDELQRQRELLAAAEQRCSRLEAELRQQGAALAQAEEVGRAAAAARCLLRLDAACQQACRVGALLLLQRSVSPRSTHPHTPACLTPSLIPPLRLLDPQAAAKRASLAAANAELGEQLGRLQAELAEAQARADTMARDALRSFDVAADGDGSGGPAAPGGRKQGAPPVCWPGACLAAGLPCAGPQVAPAQQQASLLTLVCPCPPPSIPHHHHTTTPPPPYPGPNLFKAVAKVLVVGAATACLAVAGVQLPSGGQGGHGRREAGTGGGGRAHSPAPAGSSS